jgi:hypothetical protein
MTWLVISPMLPVRRRFQIRGIALQQDEYVSMRACLWWGPGRKIFLDFTRFGLPELRRIV